MVGCRNCGSPLEYRKMLCAKCGEWTPNDAETAGHIGTVNKAKTTTLDLVEAVSLERIKTGGPWDDVWGGGFVPCSITLVGGGAGLGKALALDTPIPTAAGWTTMGKVRLGDTLFDERGIRCKVAGVTRVMRNRDCYAVTFTGGETIVADADHLWSTTTLIECAEKAGVTTSRTTRQIADSLKVSPNIKHTISRIGPLRQTFFIVDARPVPSVPVRCISVDSPSQLYLAGKSMVPTHNTTMLLQVASLFAQLSGKRAYFLSAEQSPGEIRMTAERLQISNLNQFRVMSEFGAGADIDKALLREDPPSTLVVDSVSALCGKDAHAAVVVSRNIKKLAVEFKCPAFLICHMNKQSDFAGLYTLQHDVDTLVTVSGMDNERVVQGLLRKGYPEDLLEGLRVLTAWKNRYGPTGKDYHLTMTSHGLAPMPEVEEKKKKPRGERRSEPIEQHSDQYSVQLEHQSKAYKPEAAAEVSKHKRPPKQASPKKPTTPKRSVKHNAKRAKEAVRA
jgi:hypothetical protein